ncbi:MAG: nuclear transport factor 2 family protein [Planctomycetota bacterium]
MAQVEYYLFENPWLAVIGLVVLFAVLRVLGRSTGNKKLVLASNLPVLLAGAVALAAHFVETDAEKLDAWTGAVLTASAEPDVGAMDRYIAPDAVVKNRKGEVIARWSQLRGAVDRGVISGHSYSIRGITRAKDAGVMTTAVALRTRVNGSDQAHPTGWDWVWQRGDDGQWRITEFHWRSYRGEDPGRIFDGIPYLNASPL